MTNLELIATDLDHKSASRVARTACHILGHSKKTYVCRLGGYHCARCHKYLSIRTHQAIDQIFAHPSDFVRDRTLTLKEIRDTLHREE